MLDLINFYIIPGFVLGSIYALGAVGITLTFGILRFANFAHGETMTVGAYLSFLFISLFHVSVWLVLPLVLVITIILALSIDRFFYKPLRHSPSIMLTMASFGIMLMLQSAVQFIWSTDIKSLSPGEISMPLVFFDAVRISANGVAM